MATTVIPFVDCRVAGVDNEPDGGIQLAAGVFILIDRRKGVLR
jgi:hypothetical protein